MSGPVGSGSSGDFLNHFFRKEPGSIDRVTSCIIKTLRASYTDQQIRGFTSRARVSVETPIEIAITSILRQAPKAPIKEHLKEQLAELDAMDLDVAWPHVTEIIEVAKRARLNILDLDLDKLNAPLVDRISREIANISVLKDVIEYKTALTDVAHDMLTEIFLLALVNQNGRYLQYVPQEKRTLDVCLAAVNESGYALQYVPEDKLTLDICLAAVIQDGTALIFVPKDKRTLDICYAAITHIPTTLAHNYILQYVPEDKRTLDICLAAVSRNGHELEYVPEDKLTLDVCLAAVNENGYALHYVPEDKLTLDICLAAVNQNGRALIFVPEEKLTLDICYAAITHNIPTTLAHNCILEYVPEDKRTLDICLAAVSRNGWELAYVPEDKQTQAVLLAAVNQNAFALEYVPQEKRTPDIYLVALINNLRAFEYCGGDMGDTLNFALSTALSSDVERSEGLELIKNILNYRNSEIRGFLIQVIIDQLKNGKITEAVRRPAGYNLAYARLPLLCISSWLEDGSPIPQSIINFFKTHRDAIKSKETGSLQTVLSLLMYLNSQPYPNVKKLDIFAKCLVETTDKARRVQDLNESMSRANYSMVLGSISSELLASITDFSSDNLVQLAINFLVEKKLLDNNAESIKQFRATFLSSRIPTALFSYIKSFSSISSPDFEAALKVFIDSVLKETFKADRNKANSHGSYLSPELKAAWEAGESRIGILDSEKKAVFNPSDFFDKKIKIDRHAGDKLDRFLSAIESGKPIEDPNPLEVLCLRLYSSKEEADQVSILRELEEVLKSPEYVGLEFASDIKAQMALLMKRPSSAKKITLVDSDDWQDLFLCGTEVLGSCQRVDGHPQLNKCLLGYVLDGKIRILAIKNEEGKTLSRAIFKLLLDKENRPVLFLERIYPEESSLIREFAQDRASALRLPLYEHGQTGELLHSKGNAAPFEYEDAKGNPGVKNGPYTLLGALIPPRGGTGAGAGAGAF
jgi:hypothetical protein